MYHRPRRDLRGKRIYPDRLAEITSHKLGVASPFIWIIKVDDIGDYVLFRNTLPALKRIAELRGCKLKLLGNAVWKPLWEAWDSALFDEALWLDKGKFFSNENYRREVYGIIGQHTATAVWVPNYSRSMWLEDLLARAIPSGEKFAWLNRFPGVEKWDIPILDIPYTNGPDGSSPPAWEYHRYRHFAQWLGAAADELPQRPHIPVTESFSGLSGRPYAVLFHGASAYRKKWNLNGFAEAGKYVSKNYGLDIIIAGGPGDEADAQKVSEYLAPVKAFNVVGKTTLPQLACLLAHAKVVISNDTGAAHMALAASVPTIVIANGNAYGRYFPNPKAAAHRAVYPMLFEKWIKPKILSSQNKDWKGMTVIQTVKSEAVIAAIKHVM